MSSAGPVDPRVERSRATVLAAAADLLLEGGPDAVTVDAVVERSGVARSTIYRHWSSRTRLTADALQRLLPAAHPEPPDGPLGERLQHAAAAVAREMRDSPYAPLLASLLHAALFDPGLGDFRAQFLHDRRDGLRRLAATARGRGELSDDVADDDLVSLLVGPLMMRRTVTGEPLDDAWVRGHATRVHRAVAAATGTS